MTVTTNDNGTARHELVDWFARELTCGLSEEVAMCLNADADTVRYVLADGMADAITGWFATQGVAPTEIVSRYERALDEIPAIEEG